MIILIRGRTDTDMKQSRIGAVQVAVGAIFWSFAGVLGKWLPWNAMVINGARCLVAVILLGIARGGFRVHLSKGNLLGAVSVMLTGIFFMGAVKLTTSANAIVLQYAAPAFVILFCWLFYGQKPTKRDLLAAGLIMLGVTLCFADKMGGGSLIGNILALLSAVTFALVFFCARMPDTSASDYSFLGLIFCVPSLLFAFSDPAFSTEPSCLLAAFALGVCLAGGYYFISAAMTRVSPVSAVLLSNLEPVLNPIWVVLFLPELGEVPRGLSLLGAAIVLITAAVYSVTGEKT